MKVSYYYKVSFTSSTGVLKKIESTINAFSMIGCSAQGKSIKANSLWASLVTAIHIFRDDADIMMFRSCGSLLLWMPSLVWARIAGKKIVIDVATPKKAQFLEILKNNHTTSFRKGVSAAALYFIYPLAWAPANIIIQHSYDSSWFYVPVKKKTIITGNPSPVNILDVSCDFSDKKYPADEINLIAVSHMKFWHGYDRLLQAVALHNRASNSRINVKVNIHFVGEGPEKRALELLARNLRINNHVHFHGLREYDFIRDLCRVAHIGVGALGGFRKGLHHGSAIKVREYIGSGLPVLLSTKDIDIERHDECVYYVANDESIFSIQEIIDWYLCNKYYKIEKQRELFDFYEKKLSAETKAKEIIVALGLRAA